jgi:hypothetical protein
MTPVDFLLESGDRIEIRLGRMCRVTTLQQDCWRVPTGIHASVEIPIPRRKLKSSDLLAVEASGSPKRLNHLELPEYVFARRHGKCDRHKEARGYPSTPPRDLKEAIHDRHELSPRWAFAVRDP